MSKPTVVSLFSGIGVTLVLFNRDLKSFGLMKKDHHACIKHIGTICMIIIML